MLSCRHDVQRRYRAIERARGGAAPRPALEAATAHAAPAPAQAGPGREQVYSESREARQRRKARVFCLGVRGFTRLLIEKAFALRAA